MYLQKYGIFFSMPHEISDYDLIFITSTIRITSKFEKYLALNVFFLKITDIFLIYLIIFIRVTIF